MHQVLFGGKVTKSISIWIFFSLKGAVFNLTQPTVVLTFLQIKPTIDLILTKALEKYEGAISVFRTSAFFCPATPEILNKR